MMEYDEALEKRIRCYESELCDSDRMSSDHIKQMNELRFFGWETYPSPHIRAAPLFELSWIILDTSSTSNEVNVDLKSRRFRIYGVIAVLQQAEDDDMYVLYQRPKSDPEEVELGDNLSLNGYPVTAVQRTLRVGVSLRDADSGLQLANGTFKVEYNSEHDYDVCKTVTVSGDQGFFVKLCYHTLYSALVAKVTVGVKKLKDDEVEIDVCGHIYARLNDHYLNKLGSDMKEFCYLFKRPRKDPLTMGRKQVELSRSCVAVPADSFVSLVVTLREAPTKSAIGRLKLKIHAKEGHMPTYRYIFAQHYHTHVTVNWLHPDELSIRGVNKLRKLPIELLPYNTSSGFSKAILQERKQDNGGLPWAIDGVCLVEVFSIVVDCAKRDSVGIHGRIKVHDTLGALDIFKRENTDYEILPKSRKSLSLQGPMTRSVTFKDFQLLVLLTDDKNRVISRGLMEWQQQAFDYMSWYDKRVCSVIQGDFGYASVHYTIFSRAVEAVLRVVVSTSNSVDVRATVWGTVIAQYNKFDYPTYYDHEYYRSTLFKGHSEKPVHLDGEPQVLLPLSKSVVATPSDSSLLIALDLVVVDANKVDGSSRVVKAVLDFKPFCNGAQRIKTNNGFNLTVHAEWKRSDV